MATCPHGNCAIVAVLNDLNPHHLNCQFNYWNQSVLAERAILVRLIGYCLSCETFTLPLLICSTVYCLWFIAEVCNQMAKKLAIVFFQLHSTSINCLHLWLQQKIVDESAVQDAIRGGAWNKANYAQYGIVSYCGNVPHWEQKCNASKMFNLWLVAGHHIASDWKRQLYSYL